MHGFKLFDRFKSTQVHALSPQDSNPCSRGKLSKCKFTNSGSVAQALLPCGLPTTELLEPSIDSYLKPVDYVESLAEIYRRLNTCSQTYKSLLCIEQFSILRGLGDPKLLRRCLCAARQYAIDVHSKVVLSAWLRYERRGDEFIGVSSKDCSGYILECPMAALVSGFHSNSIYDHCQCGQDNLEAVDNQILMGNEGSSLEEDSDVSFCIGDELVRCVRFKIASLSSPFRAMLYGSFVESRRDKIDFSKVGISVKGMRAVQVYSRTRRVDLFCPEIVLELLSFANRFCCEELKSVCDAHLASMVCGIEDALILIDHGLEERANFLVASCLQVFLRELPNSLYNHKVMSVFCNSEARERLAMLGHASFLLYYFLSQVAMEENMASNAAVMLLEGLEEFATEKWQKALALHQLGCIMLERKEYKGAQFYFEAAVKEGHVYSLAGVARTKYKQGQQYSAFRLTNSLIFKYKPVGWMYQERSLYGVGQEKIMDLNTATELDPTLSFPYKFRAVLKVEEKQIRAAITEIDKIISFKLSPDCLELRAWFFIALEDFESALRDIRALLTLEPKYMMFHGRVSGDHLVELLSHRVRQWSLADSWMQLYDHWSSVDDIGSLAVIHQMLSNDPAKSLLWFRQSLLLLRDTKSAHHFSLHDPTSYALLKQGVFPVHKAAMRCLRLARNHTSSMHERLIYEGWLLFDSGHREEALSRAEKSISIQRSFEAFFLMAYTLADTNLDPESSSTVIQLLEEALRCPSDGLRKGQALNNLGSIYVDCGKLDQAADCYMNALNIKHTRAHQGLARVYHLKNQRKAAFDEMTKLIEKAHSSASAYEKRSEYCDREKAKDDLNMATQLDPLRTYPYRYRAAVLMDDQKETEALEELTKAIAFKPELQMLHLRAAFYESMGDKTSALQDCEAALCLDQNHTDTLDLYNRTQDQATRSI
ncbi:ETO1-RELATED [Salix viminalis]|uniref:ETO1-RELATED n=1 Tax=Salix viminalis TaxID=40686 RepID=A0A9Q0NJH9_SALVM|nr:ETO1-RELATED [Salix viminalis]